MMMTILTPLQQWRLHLKVYRLYQNRSRRQLALRLGMSPWIGKNCEKYFIIYFRPNRLIFEYCSLGNLTLIIMSSQSMHMIGSALDGMYVFNSTVSPQTIRKLAFLVSTLAWIRDCYLKDGTIHWSFNFILFHDLGLASAQCLAAPVRQRDLHLMLKRSWQFWLCIIDTFCFAKPADPLRTYEDRGYSSAFRFQNLKTLTESFVHTDTDCEEHIVIRITLGRIFQPRKIPAEFNSKLETDMVGLQNLGATCYLNALLQVLRNFRYR